MDQGASGVGGMGSGRYPSPSLVFSRIEGSVNPGQRIFREQGGD